MTIDALFVIIIIRPLFFGPWPEGQANIVVVWKFDYGVYMDFSVGIIILSHTMHIISPKE